MPDRMIGLIAAALGLAVLVAPLFMTPSTADPATVPPLCERIPSPPSEMEPMVPRQSVDCPYGYRPRAAF